MERKQIIRIAMRITESIIEILKEEFGNDEKGNRKNENKHKKTKKSIKSSR